MITLDQAKSLSPGTILHHVQFKNKDKSPMRWRVNGKPKTWKRSPERVQVPIKHGMYDFDYLTERDLDLVCLSVDEIEK
jgi:hypothetical protein